jgi:O-antigen ligase
VEDARAPTPVDWRLVESFAVLAATAMAAWAFTGSDLLAGMLAVPALALHAAVLWQPRPSPAARVGSLVVLVVTLAVLPGLAQAVAFAREPTMAHGQDGGVAVTNLAVRALLDGRDPTPRATPS